VVFVMFGKMVSGYLEMPENLPFVCLNSAGENGGLSHSCMKRIRQTS